MSIYNNYTYGLPNIWVQIFCFAQDHDFLNKEIPVIQIKLKKMIQKIKENRQFNNFIINEQKWLIHLTWKWIYKQKNISQ